MKSLLLGAFRGVAILRSQVLGNFYGRDNIRFFLDWQFSFYSRPFIGRSSIASFV